jgi:hypothetical protein
MKHLRHYSTCFEDSYSMIINKYKSLVVEGKREERRVQARSELFNPSSRLGLASNRPDKSGYQNKHRRRIKQVSAKYRDLIYFFLFYW